MCNILEPDTEEASSFQSIFYPKGHARSIWVPDYQRAFAWEDKQIALFIKDLGKYELSQTGYYFGHFIVEGNEEGWAVVDGQQRLTTFVLFLMVCRVLSPGDLENPAFSLTERFSTVSYDAEALKTISVNLESFLNVSVKMDAKSQLTDEQIVAGLGLSKEKFSRSQRRMVLALLWFHKAFHKGELKQEKIACYIGIVLNSLCSHHLTRNKSVAVNIFEMHNTRGVPLSILEIIKAKLMKFVYDHGNSERNAYVKQIQEEFGAIYCMEEQLAARSFRGEMTMEQLLLLHFRSVDDGSKRTEEEFRSPASNASADDLITYLETRLNFADSRKAIRRPPESGVQYALKLAEEFKKSVRIVSKDLPTWDEKDPLVGDVLILEPSLSCQFFLITCRLLEESPNQADGKISSEVLSLWEKLLFTRDFHGAYHNLRGERDNFPELFQKCRAGEACILDVIQGYLTNGFRAGRTAGLQAIVVKQLLEHKKRILNEAFGWWWLPKLKYAIYKYEVRENAAIRKVMKGMISVEHILPQEWEWAWVEEEDVPPKNGNEFKTQPVREAVLKQVNTYIHGIGNLLLLTPGENTGQGNKHPAKKRYMQYCSGGSYQEHDNNREKWKSSSEWPNLIHARGEKIFQFMLDTLVDASGKSTETSTT